MEGKRSIANVLQQEFNKRSFITGIEMDAGKLFHSDKLRKWINQILENDEMSELAQRVDGVSPERLLHAVATYLLGIAVREGLGLNFDFLPRIFSKGSYGDAFYFFWSVICLCHDLGYQYERGEYDQNLMNTPEGRRNLLKIEYDMFELKKNLDKFGGTEEEKGWILQALDLAQNYDRMRRSKTDNTGDGPRIDHGIAGALILYDFLMKEYHRAMEKKKSQIGLNRYRDLRLAAQEEALSGEVSANIYNSRFPVCAILIACTVARHNMWIPGASAHACYRRYGLDFLCEKQAVISTENTLDQMLFMLDFMDTIDPVKGMYTREAENGADSWVLENRQRLILNGIVLKFKMKSEHQYRWETALQYQELTIAIERTEGMENKRIFSEYADDLKYMNNWMKTKPPRFQKDSEGNISGVTLYYPNVPRKQRQWVGGISENEIASLCLYVGSGGNGKSELFYQYHNAYQTLNLIMMDGMDGEQARICEEKQNPNGLYIREWKKTLEVMTDIFTAQCKFMEYWYKEKGEIPILYRVDREVNFKMMQDLNRTFAFTSTSKKDYLENIARVKKNLIFQEIVLAENVPFIDYAELLQEMYVYSEEEEVLLPPFLELVDVSSTSDTGIKEQNKIADEQSEVTSYYNVKFGKFKAWGEHMDESILIERLDKNKEVAAAFLENIKKNRKIGSNAEEIKQYQEWKKDFQTLLRNCFFNIGKAYGIDKR